MKAIYLLFLTSFFIVSCGGYSEDEQSKFNAEIQSIIKKNKWDMTKSESGSTQGETTSTID